MQDAFISFSFNDQEVTEYIVNALTARYGVSCWICTRDIHGGSRYKQLIPPAIRSSSVVVFIQSANSIASKEIPKEIGIALQADKTIIPFRLDDTPLSPELEYDLFGVEYIDAAESELDSSIRKLAVTISNILGRPFEEKEEQKEAPAEDTEVSEETAYAEEEKTVTVSDEAADTSDGKGTSENDACLKLDTDDNAEDTSDEEKPHVHSYIETVIPPTCKEGGYSVYECSCGDSYRGSYTKSTDHVWSPWVKSSEGNEVSRCTLCGLLIMRPVQNNDPSPSQKKTINNENSEENIPHTHSFIYSVIRPTCEDKGYTIHKCSCGYSFCDSYTPAKGHAWSPWEKSSDGNEVSRCTVCGKVTLRPVKAAAQQDQTILPPQWTQEEINALFKDHFGKYSAPSQIKSLNNKKENKKDKKDKKKKK